MKAVTGLQARAYLQLANARHGSSKQHHEHASAHSSPALLILQSVGCQMRGHQRGGAGRVRGHARAAQAKGVGDSADEEVHAIACRHIGANSNPQACTYRAFEVLGPS